MKIVYVVAPLALCAAFAGYVIPASIRLEEQIAMRQAAEEGRLEAERCEHAARVHAAAEAERTRRDKYRRDQEEKERAARELQQARDRELLNRLGEARAERDELRSGIAALETRLRELEDERVAADSALHAARAALASRHIERRNLDLELQRMTLLLAESVDTNVIGHETIFPAPVLPSL